MNKFENKNKVNSNNEIKSLSNKKTIKYVAIGDSYVCGFNSKFGFNANGKLENNVVTGLGYPSFFASLLQQNKNLELESYYNLALPTANIDLWEALVLNNKDKIKLNQNRLDFLEQLDSDPNNPFINFFTSLFKQFNFSKNDFKIINEKLKDASIVTISLGFNDFLFSIPFSKVTRISKLENNLKKALIDQVKFEIDQIAEVLIKKLIFLVEKIRLINKSCHIIFVNYSKPTLYFENVIENYFNLNREFGDTFLNYLFSKLNNILHKVAINTKNSYVNCFDESYWEKNKMFLTENMYSFFPTEKGYKKIAMDLYTKLTINKDLLLKEIKTNQRFHDYILDYSYWTNDINFYNTLFEENMHPIDLFKKIYGNNLNYNVLVYSKNELTYSSLLSPYLNISIFINLFVRYVKQNVYFIAKKFLEDKFVNSTKKYKSIELILKYLSNSERSKEIFLTLFKNGKLEKMFFKLQIEIFKKFKEEKQLTLNTLKNNWNNVIGKDQKLLYDVAKQFFDANMIENNKKDIKEIVVALAQDAVNSTLLEYMYNFKMNAQYQKIREYISNLSSFQNLLDFFVDSVTRNSNVYSSLSSFDQLWKYWITNNKYGVLYLLDKTFLEISDKNSIKKTVEFVKETILVTNHIIKLDEKDNASLEKNLEEIILILKENPKHLNRLIKNFMNKIKNYSLFNLIIKKTATQKLLKLSNWVNIKNIWFILFKLSKKIIVIKNIINKNKKANNSDKK
ncbi:SGNH/GDSL hydrolase family protein [Metamycoplasma buccale]|uniref:SGNH/GDSL hydrolase family protein n=1 Tax=Metamycoplasma buccale TaxID=55602 RepID=UPI00398F2735